MSTRFCSWFSAARLALGLPASDRHRGRYRPAAPGDASAPLQPAMVVGGIFFAIGFMLGVGAASDWLKWARGIETPFHHGNASPARGSGPVTSASDYSHKVIGVQYAITGILLLGVGGTLAMIFRLQLAQPELNFMPPDVFNTMISAHGMVMIGAHPAGRRRHVQLPGAADDRRQRHGLPAAERLCLLDQRARRASCCSRAMFLGGFDTGWTGYPPLSAQGPAGHPVLLPGRVSVIGLSSILGSLNIIVTTMPLRAQGHELVPHADLRLGGLRHGAHQPHRHPADRPVVPDGGDAAPLGLGFFDPGGPVWYEGTRRRRQPDLVPAPVLVLLAPGGVRLRPPRPGHHQRAAAGLRPQAALRLQVGGHVPLAIALVGFLVWAHHMFVSGMSNYLRVPFMMSTLLVAVPTGVKFFCWVGTLWGGKIEYKSRCFSSWGGSGLSRSAGYGPPRERPLTDLTPDRHLLVVGHFHATMFGGFIFPFFAALYYWFPKASGRMYSEWLRPYALLADVPAFWVMLLGQFLHWPQDCVAASPATIRAAIGGAQMW